MRCSEVRNLALAYIDSELDARASREIDLHIGACDGCRRIYETEQRFAEKLNHALGDLEATPDLWAAIEAGILAMDRPENPAPEGVTVPPKIRHPWFKLSGRLAFSAAASLVLVLALGAGTSWWLQAHEPLDLAAAMEHCHLAHAAEIADPAFTSAPGPADLASARGRLDTSAFEVRPGDPAFTVSGSRLCELKGVPVAFVLAEHRSVPVSMIVMNDTELPHFPGASKRLDSHPIACSELGHNEFGARRVDGHVVCMMGDLPRSEIESLLASIPSTR